jgi:hypothetical protein
VLTDLLETVMCFFLEFHFFQKFCNVHILQDFTYSVDHNLTLDPIYVIYTGFFTRATFSGVQGSEFSDFILSVCYTVQYSP